MLNEVKNWLKSNDIREICEDLGPIDEGKLAGLHKQLKKGIEEHKRAETCWEDILENAFLMEDILENRNSRDRKMRSTFWIERNGNCNNIIDTFSNKPIITFIIYIYSVFISINNTYKFSL